MSDLLLLILQFLDFIVELVKFLIMLPGVFIAPFRTLPPELLASFTFFFTMIIVVVLFKLKSLL